MTDEVAPMKQSRRLSPRIPYDEAICLARVDGAGRYYVQTCDLSASGMLAVSAESCPVGTDVQFSLLLPGGPRKVGGRVVRVTANPAGYGLAIAFMSIEASVVAAIERLIADHQRAVMPAKLRVAGLEHALRCEAHVQVDEGKMRLTANLPFLRLDDGVAVTLGKDGAQANGVIRKIALDPATSDGVPRLSVDIALAGGPPPSLRDAADASEDWLPPPSQLPPLCGPALPSVVVSHGLTRDVQHVEARPPRRRVHGTAEVARRPMSDWSFAPTALPVAARTTARLDLRLRAWRRVPALTGWSYLLMLVPAALLIAAALMRGN
jgi:hypothetical protein